MAWLAKARTNRQTYMSTLAQTHTRTHTHTQTQSETAVKHPPFRCHCQYSLMLLLSGALADFLFVLLAYAATLA